jgi:aryl-alcohol dehydrogenase-like predicted oxidoreductase
VRYKLLGKTGLRVSELCLGTMTFGEDWGFGAPRPECQRIFEAFAAAGGNFVDTANHYTNGSAERMLGELMGRDRHRYVVATKYTLNGRPEDPNAGGNHRKSLVQALEGSLKRLGTDYLDLYWVHAWDRFTPVEETMRALDDVVRSGKVLYLGISDTPAWVVARANTLAELRGWTPFSAVQAQYSLVERSLERDLWPMASELDLAVTAWGVLGSGVLSGKYRRGDDRAADGRLSQGSWGADFLTPRNYAIAEELERVAGEMDRTPSQVALAWIRHARPGLTAPIVPIIGARKLSQLQDNLGCLEIQLGPGALDRLETASPLDPGFPHGFLQSPAIQQLVHGATLERIDDHRRRR